MATSADERVAEVRFDADRIIVDLMDGRTIAAPLAWFPRLLNASSEQRARWHAPAAVMGCIGPSWTKI